MELSLWVCHGVEGRTIVGRGVALAEKVGLYLATSLSDQAAFILSKLDLPGVTTQELPVNLVKVIGLEHDRADDTYQ